MVVPSAITATMLVLIWGAITVPKRWRCPVAPLFAAIFVSSYTHFSFTYVSWFGGEPEIGMFLVLGIWPLLGYLFLTRQFHLVWQTAVFTVALFAYFLLVHLSQGPAFALIDIVSIISWQISMGFYCLVMWRLGRPTFIAHCTVSTMAALIDLGTYFFIAQVLRFDPVQEGVSTWEVYEANVRMALVYPTLYSIPLFFRLKTAYD